MEVTFGWKEARLGEVVTFQRGYDLPHRARRAGVIPIVTSAGITDYHSVPMVKSPGVVTGRYGTIGEVFFITEDFWPLNTTLYVRDFHGNDPRFIYYLLHRFDFISFSGKSGVPGVNRNDLHKETVVLPVDIEEQRAIAEALSDVDGLLGGQDRLIAKKRDLKQAAMQQLLTSQTRLPGFHGEWGVKRLDELGTWKGGMTPSMQNPAFWLNGNLPWISSGDVKSTLLKETGFSITSAAIRQGVTTLLPDKSIVIVTRSGILRKYLPVAMNVVPMAINQDIKALIPAREFYAPFLLHSLISNGDRILASCLKAGTTVESVEFRWLKAFTIPVPLLPEQTAIAAVLSDMDAELAALEQRREKTRALKQAMMQELLTGRTRLVVAAAGEPHARTTSP